jgi:hypothetical protein
MISKLLICFFISCIILRLTSVESTNTPYFSTENVETTILKQEVQTEKNTNPIVFQIGNHVFSHT